MISSPPNISQCGKAYATRLPWLGLAAGILLAVAGVQKYQPGALATDEAARINGASIPLQEWQRAIDAANSGRRTPLASTEEQRVLDTLINEELLLQMALNMGLAHGIPEVRGKLVQAAMDALADAGQDKPTQAALESFARAQASLFQQPERRLSRVARYRSAADAEQGIAPAPVDLPTGPLNERQLQRWVGQTLAQAVFSLPPDQPQTPVIAIGQAWYRAELLEIQPAYHPPADAIPHEQLLRAWQRQQREKTLADALQELRDAADISRIEPTS